MKSIVLVLMSRLLLILFVIMTASGLTWADTWALPKKETVCSQNKKFCFKVIPKKLKGQLEYFEDKVAGKENAGADDRVRKNLARGIFYRRDDNGILRKRWEINLVNEVAPVSILVSDAGDHVVTFDNWHSVGYGDDVVVIYEGFTGRLIKKLGLTDFLTEKDVSQLSHSASSIWWGGGHFFDRERREVVLQIAKNGRPAFESDREFFPIRIELSSGRVLDEVIDRFPSLQFQIRDKSASVDVADEILPIEFKECIAASGSTFVASDSLLRRATNKIFPPYPPAARAVRATGQITVGLVIDNRGVVVCSASVTGHPLLRAAVSGAVKDWNFDPGEEPVHGFITFEGSWLLVSPDGKIINSSNKP